MTEGDPEELIACPFDPVHLLRRKRMPYHIIKCGKNFNKKDFRVCPFNSRHVVPKNDLESHLHQCQDRGILEREILHSQQAGASDLVPVQKGYTELPVSTFIPPEPEESWDDSNVRVDIPHHDGLFMNASPKIAPKQKAPPTRVREPPNPRVPVMTRGSDSEVFKLATTKVETSPPAKARGRGRGRGIIAAPPMLGGQELQVSPPGAVLGKGVGLGRGRGVALHASLVAQAVCSTEETEKKKEKKLKKMLRQIVELEVKVQEGLTLNEDQTDKLARKEDVLSKLQQFHV